MQGWAVCFFMRTTKSDRTDLSLRLAHMSEGTFFQVATQLGHGE